MYIFNNGEKAPANRIKTGGGESYTTIERVRLNIILYVQDVQQTALRTYSLEFND